MIHYGLGSAWVTWRGHSLIQLRSRTLTIAWGWKREEFNSTFRRQLPRIWSPWSIVQEKVGEIYSNSLSLRGRMWRRCTSKENSLGHPCKQYTEQPWKIDKKICIWWRNVLFRVEKENLFQHRVQGTQGHWVETCYAIQNLIRRVVISRPEERREWWRR